MRFKQWLSEQIGLNPTVAAPSQNLTGDTRTLQTALQSTLQDPNIPNIVTQNNSNPTKMASKIIPIAQTAMKRSPASSNNINVTPMDVAKAAMPQLQMPKPQMQTGAKPGTQPLS